MGEHESHLIEGIIVGRRSLGRKLAFADIALNSSANHASTHSNNDSGPTARHGSSHSSETTKSINIIFTRQSFLGPSKCDVQSNGQTFDEPFPTKMTSLPYGASVVVQLGKCQKVPSNDASGRIEDVWEVTRWKMKENPRELAEKLASLENQSLSEDMTSLAINQERNQPACPEVQQIVMGSGAMSCSTYLKARREAFDLAKQHEKRLKEVDAVASDQTDMTHTAGIQVDGKSTKTTLGSTATLGDVPASSLNAAHDMIVSEFDHGGKHAKAKRARIFASWTLETFFGIPMSPLDIVGEGNGEMIICQPCSTSNAETTINPSTKNVHVLDIAGGKGQLSLELILQQMSFQCPFSSNIVDEKKEDENDSSTMKPIAQCTIIDPMVRKGDAKHWRSRMKRARSRLDWIQQQGQNQNGRAANTTPQDDETSSKSDKKRSRSDDGASSIKHLATCFSTETFPELRSQCVQPNSEASASTLLLLGLHPDQCTEDILDVALEHNLSVAIVPCCVYPDLFPSRRMVPRTTNSENTHETRESNHHNGNIARADQRERSHDTNLVPVRTYDEFLQYLLDKDDQLQITTLPFEGKNRVIYKRVS